MEKSNKKLIIFIILAFVTLLIIASSVFFSMQNFTAYCYNATDSQLDGQIAEFVASENKNVNIFTLDENKIKRNVENKFPNVRVVNVERIFPNSVKVNYSIVKAYAVASDGGLSYYLSGDCKILKSDGGEEAQSGSFITLETNEVRAAGDYFYAKTSKTALYFDKTISVMERLGFTDCAQIIASVDFRDLSVNVLKITTRAGAQIHVIYPDSNFDSKMQLVMSAFFKNDETKRRSGVWTVSTESATWSANQ